MTTASVQTTEARVRERSLVDRLLAVVPAIAIGVSVLLFYGIQAWLRKTPWVFTDELEWSQISRSIASTGHAARRGQDINFKSLYAFAIAPFWWIHSTSTAYSAIKYLNVALMTSAAIPTYLLARMLVSRRSASVVAVLSVAVPAMAYVTTLVPEVLAYPYYALCSWLIVRAFASGKRRDIVIAGIVAVFAIAVRAPQFATVPAAFIIAGAGLWITSPRGRELRSKWTKGDTMGAVVLIVGALFLFNRVILQHVPEWQISTQHYKNRMVDLGLRAGLSFTIGMGILPVLGGFASLRVKERRDDPVYRAWVAYASATIFCVSLYTAIKAAYLSTIFATLWEERNLIYLAPIMLIGTAIVVESKRIDWRVVGGACALVLVMVLFKQFQLDYPYFEAPGFGIATAANRHLGWNVYDLRLASVVVLAVSVGLLAVRRRRMIAPLIAVLAFAWMMTSEIATTAGVDKMANSFRDHLPAQLTWVDHYSQGQPVTYIGQELKDNNGLWLTEFWNRSLQHVDSLDGSAPGPGPTGTPNVETPDGTLSNLTNVPYVLADGGVVLQAPVVHSEQNGVLRLYRKPAATPWRLLDALQQVYSDGWCPAWCSYTYFKPNEHGTLVIRLSRTAFNGNGAPPGQVRISVGSVRINPAQQTPVLKYVYLRQHTVIGNGSERTISIPIRRTPVRVELRIHPTFNASNSDARNLGAQVGFKFVPAKKQPR
jgi:hypothetical protein